MAQAVIFPKLGQTMEEGAIVKWLKREGDAVAKGDILFEIETDKANLEVESFFEGTLLKILVPPGVTVPVNTVVGYVGAAGEAVPDRPPAVPSVPTVATVPTVPTVSTVPTVPTAPTAPTAPIAPVAPTAPPAPATLPARPSRLIISPRARALARDKAIDPARIRGSGPQGRIVTRDVEAYLAAQHYDDLRIAPAAKCLAQAQSVDLLTVRGSGEGGRILVGDVERAIRRRPQPLPRMRQVIARRLVESKQTIPHFYVTVTADMTDLLRFRAELKARGAAFSVNDFILSAVVQALDEFPVVNSVSDGQSVTWRGDVDLGVAVSLDQGLVVPVIRAAQLLSLTELRDQARALTTKARDGKLTPDEMTGSSFTVSNMGMLDVDHFAAIINPGEAAILAVATAREMPAVVDGQVRVRSRMAMTLSADHRVIDGATAARFVNAIRNKLERVALWQSLV